MKRTFTAMFSNGKTLKRVSVHRVYRFAWLGIGKASSAKGAMLNFHGQSRTIHGFTSGDRERAERNMAVECRYLDLSFSEIAAVTEVTP